MTNSSRNRRSPSLSHTFDSQKETKKRREHPRPGPRGERSQPTCSIAAQQVPSPRQAAARDGALAHRRLPRCPTTPWTLDGSSESRRRDWAATNGRRPALKRPRPGSSHRHHTHVSAARSNKGTTHARQFNLGTAKISNRVPAAKQPLG